MPGNTDTETGDMRTWQTKFSVKSADLHSVGALGVCPSCWKRMASIPRRQLFLMAGSIAVFLYLTILCNSYVWRTFRISSGVQSRDLSGYGFRKLLEEGDSIFEKSRPERTEKMERRLPQCIIFGVRKCGTRALLEFLDLHPQIQAANAEMHFFNEEENYAKGLSWYKERMPYSYSDQITIEKTPRYFISEEAAGRVSAMNSSIKLIVILRHPTTRVISDYTQVYENKILRNKSVERFEDIVYDSQRDRINTEYKAIRISVYHYHLARWLSFFNRQQIHVVDGDNLINNPLQEIKKIETFLDIDHSITTSHLYFNETRGFYCMRRDAAEHCLGLTKGRKHPYIDPRVIRKLNRFFHPHNKKLFRLIGREFDWNS